MREFDNNYNEFESENDKKEDIINQKNHLKKEQKKYSFTYLNQLIHNGQKEITLEGNVILEENEEDKFPEGILVDIDNLVIDGNGHSIDAKEKTRIFKITGKNIRIKNITLQRGYTTENGGAIFNENGTVTIINGILQENRSLKGGAIYNDSALIIKDTTIKENTAKIGGAIYNIYDGLISVTNTILEENHSGLSGAVPNNYVLTIKNTNFDINNFKGGSIEDTFNDEKLILKESTFINTEKIMLNDAVIFANNELLEKILDEIDVFIPSEENNKDFRYLNQLIHDSNPMIKLENDIKLDVNSREDEMFPYGIVLDIDDMVIDGNGHSIDAQGLIRIFKVKGKNITIKNLTLKNGNSERGSFEGKGGSIINYRGVLTLQNIILEENRSKTYGGAIYNDEGTITIKSLTLHDNISRYGGAIYNAEGFLTIKDATVQKNCSKSFGGAIINLGGSLIIKDSTLEENLSKCNGGAIINYEGTVTVSNTFFNNNSSGKEYTEDICNNGILILIESIFNTDKKTILNEEDIYVKKDTEEIIKNEGNIYYIE